MLRAFLDMGQYGYTYGNTLNHDMEIMLEINFAVDTLKQTAEEKTALQSHDGDW